MSIYGESNGEMVRPAPSRPVSRQRTEPRCDAQAGLSPLAAGELDLHVAMVCGSKRLSRAEVKKMACGGAALLVAVTIATVVTLAGGRTAGAGAGSPGTIAALEAAEHDTAACVDDDAGLTEFLVQQQFRGCHGRECRHYHHDGNWTCEQVVSAPRSGCDMECAELKQFCCACNASSTSSIDTAALLAFKADNSRVGALSDWIKGTDPCGDGWDDGMIAGMNGECKWGAVMCNRRGGRVVYIGLVDDSFRHTTDSYPDRCLSGDLAAFIPMTELQVLILDRSCGEATQRHWQPGMRPAVRGNLADLGGLTQLRMLWLLLGEDPGSCGHGDPCKINTAVHGPLESLAGLLHLGEECTTVPVTWELGGSRCFFMARETITGDSALALQGTNAYGSASSLRAIPGVGSDWGRGRGPTGGQSFVPCSTFDKCDELGSLVADAENVAGSDECACCAASTLQHDEDTGLCVGALLRGDFAVRSSEPKRIACSCFCRASVRGGHVRIEARVHRRLLRPQDVRR